MDGSVRYQPRRQGNTSHTRWVPRENSIRTRCPEWPHCHCYTRSGRCFSCSFWVSLGLLSISLGEIVLLGVFFLLKSNFNFASGEECSRPVIQRCEICRYRIGEVEGRTDKEAFICCDERSPISHRYIAIGILNWSITFYKWEITDGPDPMMVLIPFDRLSTPQYFRNRETKDAQFFICACNAIKLWPDEFPKSIWILIEVQACWK